MKTISITILLCLALLDLNAQTNVALGLNGTKRILASDNIIYIANRSDGTISKINVNNTLPTVATEIISGLNGPFGMAIKGNDLYFTQFFGNKVSKIDVTQSNPVIEDVVTGISLPTALEFKGNELYIAIGGAHKISKIDITASNPTLIDVVNMGLQFPIDLTSDENNLYLLDDDSHIIYKIDINAPLPVIPQPIITLENAFALTLIDSSLYYGELTERKVYKIDVTQTNPQPQEVLNNSSATGFTNINNELYIADTGKIIKTTIETLSLPNLVSETEISIYPNPSSDYITISKNNSDKNYTIYNVLGEKVISNELLKQSKISISHLENGIYFLKLDSYKTLKFIKQ